MDSPSLPPSPSKLEPEPTSTSVLSPTGQPTGPGSNGIKPGSTRGKKKQQEHDPEDYAHFVPTILTGADVMYDTHDDINDRVTSPKRRNTVLERTGHIPMNQTAPKDPRQTHVHPPTSPDVGPGTFNLDPMNSRTTGLSSFQPNQSHRMLPFDKDPTRESPAFKAPGRGEEASSILEEKLRNSRVSTMFPPDYKSWTAKGCFTTTQPRRIEAERWGPTARELRPPAKELNQQVYDLQFTNTGKPATCQQNSKDRNTPLYKKPFSSRLPRMSVLPSGKPDTRIAQTLHQTCSNTPDELGPGAYASDLPLYLSHHSVFEGKQVYYSMAATPTSPAHWEIQQAGWRSPPTTRMSSPKRVGLEGRNSRSQTASSPQGEVKPHGHPQRTNHHRHSHHSPRGNSPTRAPYMYNAPLPPWPTTQHLSSPLNLTGGKEHTGFGHTAGGGESVNLIPKPVSAVSNVRIISQSPVPLPLYAKNVPRQSPVGSRVGTPVAQATPRGVSSPFAQVSRSRLNSPRSRVNSPRLQASSKQASRTGSPALHATRSGGSPTSKSRVGSPQLKSRSSSQALPEHVDLSESLKKRKLIPASRTASPGLSDVVVRLGQGQVQQMDVEAEALQARSSLDMRNSLTAPPTPAHAFSGALDTSEAFPAPSQQQTEAQKEVDAAYEMEMIKAVMTGKALPVRESFSGNEKPLVQERTPEQALKEAEAEMAYIQASQEDWVAHQAVISMQYLATDFLRGTIGSQQRCSAMQSQQKAPPSYPMPTKSSGGIFGSSPFPPPPSTAPDAALQYLPHLGSTTPWGNNSSGGQGSLGGVGQPPSSYLPQVGSTPAWGSTATGPEEVGGQPQSYLPQVGGVPAWGSTGQEDAAGQQTQGVSEQAAAKVGGGAVDGGKEGMIDRSGEGVSRAQTTGSTAAGRVAAMASHERTKTPPFVHGSFSWMEGLGASTPLSREQQLDVEYQDDLPRPKTTHFMSHQDLQPYSRSRLHTPSRHLERAVCDQLCFLRRVESHKKRINTRLDVVADLLAARKAKRLEATA